LDAFVLCLVTGLGLGRIPSAPGTFGSLLGLPLVSGLQHLPPVAQGIAAVVLFLIGVPLCTRGARLMHAKDPGAIVYDEIAAFPVLFLVARLTPFTAIAGFALFRLFDITKPWPVRQFEKLPEGWGLMADDLVAGIYAGAALWLLVQTFPTLAR
jgi:phosphatidylglycerophosphatase A